MGGGARAVLLLHSFFQVTEFNKLGVKLLVLSTLDTATGREEVGHLLWRGREMEGQKNSFCHIFDLDLSFAFLIMLNAILDE